LKSAEKLNGEQSERGRIPSASNKESFTADAAGSTLNGNIDGA